MDIYKQKSAIDLQNNIGLCRVASRAKNHRNKDKRWRLPFSGRFRRYKFGQYKIRCGQQAVTLVATAIQEYATNQGIGSYLNMSSDEIARVINSVVADENLRQAILYEVQE